MSSHEKERQKNADALAYLLKQITRANIIVLENAKDMPDHWDAEEIEQALNIVGEFIATCETMYRVNIESYIEETLHNKLKEVFDETTR